ncbi:hypothetical protein B296_00041256 [Ensete ventricosum]|uniref:Uncharacterized protein n=1 Tax=Ensete ventricosum TaxID=4639 RepID=A0A426ZMD8_ENSVE|nr:hypothetical protein B296_00041256 [Ensete ventricosum]
MKVDYLALKIRSCNHTADVHTLICKNNTTYRIALSSVQNYSVQLTTIAILLSKVRHFESYRPVRAKKREKREILDVQRCSPNPDKSCLRAFSTLRKENLRSRGEENDATHGLLTEALREIPSPSVGFSGRRRFFSLHKEKKRLPV